MLFTPRQLARHAEFYQRLGQFTAAGIGVYRALEHLQTAPPSASYQAAIWQLLADLTAGRTLTQAFERRSDVFPAFDADLLQAAERSGRLDDCFCLLAQHYAERSRIARTAVHQLLYPAVLLHIGIFIFVVLLPFARSEFSASLAGLGGRALLTLAPFYLLASAFIYLLQGSRAGRWGALLESILSRIPVLGAARKSIALAQLSSALDALVGAGVNLIDAWGMGARASGSAKLRVTVDAWQAQLVAGQTPAQLLRGNPIFPVAFANLYSTGEMTGKLQATLRQLHRMYLEEGERKLALFATLVPRALYFLVALYLGYQVIRSATNYFDLIEQVWKG